MYFSFQYFVDPCSQLGLLAPSVHSKVFGELPAIKALNRELYDKLCLPLKEISEARQTEAVMPYSNWDTSNFLQINVGEAFLEIAPFFKVYASYASSYQQNLSLIQVILCLLASYRLYLASRI